MAQVKIKMLAVINDRRNVGAEMSVGMDAVAGIRVRECRAIKNTAGISLIELLIAIVVISIALTASLNAISTLSGRSSDVLVQSRASELAQLYLDEILSKDFDTATPLGGVPAYSGGCRVISGSDSRDQFDDVDDYHQLDETPQRLDQNLANLYQGFRVQVNVSCDNNAVLLASGVNSGGAKRIEVAITDPRGQVSRFSAFKGNF